MSAGSQLQPPVFTAQAAVGFPPREGELATGDFAVPRPNFWSLLLALKQVWLPAVVIGVLAAAVVAVALWFVIPAPKPMARSLLYVSARAPYLMYPSNEGGNSDTFQRSQPALVKSRVVLNAVLKRPDVANLAIIQKQDDAVQWLEKEIQVDFSVGPETMRISLKGDDPRELVALVSAVTKTYLEEFGEKEKNNRARQIERLRTTLQKYDEKLTTKKKYVDDMVGSTGNTHVLNFKQEIALQEGALAKREFLEIQSQRRKVQVKLAGLEMENFDAAIAVLRHFDPLAAAGLISRQRAKDQAVPAFIKDKIDDLIRNDRDFKVLFNREAGLVDLIRALGRILPKDQAEIAIAVRTKELEALRADMEVQRAALRPKIYEKIRLEAKIGALSTIGQLQAERGYLLLLEKELLHTIDEAQKTEKSLSKETVNLDSQKKEVKSLEDRCKNFESKIEVLEVEQSAPVRVKELEDAVVYRGGSSAQRLGMVGIGGLGSFALVLLAFGWWEFRAHKVGSDGVVRSLGMTLVGTLPDHRRHASTGASQSRYGGIFSDSVDAVRTSLLFMSRKEGIRAVMVTSSMPGEGKTSTASHLAMSLARSGRKTLLVDADLRNPIVHKLLHVEHVPGLNELLRDEASLDEAIRPTTFEGLFVIPAGQASSQTLPTLAREKPGEIIKQLKERFDFVIVDSSPVLGVPDTLLVAQHVDAVVLSLLRDVSRLPRVQAAAQKLASLGVRILGAIFNGSKEDGDAGYIGLPRHDP